MDKVNMFPLLKKEGATFEMVTVYKTNEVTREQHYQPSSTQSCTILCIHLRKTGSN